MSFPLTDWLTGFAPGVAGLPQPVVGGGEDKTLTVIGWLMGRQVMLRGEGAEQEPGEPVAYLYNGARLPALPAWDKTAYPYAVIRRSATTETAWLLVSGQPLYCYWSPYSNTSDRSYIELPAPFIKYQWTGGSEWELHSSGNFRTNVSYYKNGDELPTMWANFNLTWNSDGEIVVEASEPVPVYE